MGYQMPERPVFLERALQGLSHWIGHRAAMFNNYPLPEAAIVAEMSNLIYANLSDDQKLCPEVMYRRLMNIEGTNITHLARADLVVLFNHAPNPYENEVHDCVQFVFEVKRASSSEELINEDLRRLLEFKIKCNTEARAFLIVVSEGKLPKRFVDEKKGESLLHSHPIPETNGVYHVRRTLKAASSFKSIGSAHYVCIVEVFENKPNKLPKFK